MYTEILGNVSGDRWVSLYIFAKVSIWTAEGFFLQAMVSYYYPFYLRKSAEILSSHWISAFAKHPTKTLALAEEGREQNLGKKEKARLGNLASKLF